jgi:serine protease Do
MSKRAVLTAIVLVTSGILFGAVLVTSFSGIGLSLAGPTVQFNTSAPVTPSASVAELNQAFRAVAAEVTPQVVFISVKTRAQVAPQMEFFRRFGLPEQEQQQEENLQQGNGSGIILTADGYILTNRHVIENAVDNGITVTLNDSREFSATVIGEDENTDIAVIKIEASGLSAAALGNSDEVQVGEWILAVGNPLGYLSFSVTSGIVSAISRNIGVIGDRRSGLGIENFIQTDAVINPGNSGGPMVNLKGQVIGVNTAIATSGFGRSFIGYGFAVPINLAKTIANVLIKEGKFVRGYIGVNIRDIDAKMAEALGLDRYRGVLVEKLVEDGAGEAAGIKVGDAIVEVDGKPVESANQLQARVGMHRPGETIALKLMREGVYKTINVTLKGRDNETVADANTEKKDEKKEAKPETLDPVNFDNSGFTVRPLNEQQKKQFKLDRGVLVERVKRNSPAWDSGLPQGVVIFEAIRKGKKIPIESVSDLKKFAGSLSKDESVLLRVQLPDGEARFVSMKAPID